MRRTISFSAALITGIFAVPHVAAAQELGNIQTLVESFGNIVDALIPIAFALILLAFFWGLAKYVMNADDEEARDQGKYIMIGGIIALFVAAAIWGIIQFLETAILGENADTTEQPVPGIENN